MSGLDRLAASAARAWAARASLARVLGVRGLATLAPELLAVALIARGAWLGALAAGAAWLALEVVVGGRADARACALLGAAPLAEGAERVAWARTVLPLGVLVAPAAAVALALGVRASASPRAVVEVLLLGAAASAITAPIAAALHLAVGAAYATGSRATARAWARAHRRWAVETAALSGTLRFGAAWLASALAALFGRDPLWLWGALALAAVPARAVALAAWVEVTCAGSAPRR